MKKKAKKADATGKEQAAGGEANTGILVDKLAARVRFPFPDAQQDLDPAIANKAAQEAPELLSVLKNLSQRAEGLQGATRKVFDRFLDVDVPAPNWGAGELDGPATYVEAKVQMLLGYIIGLVYYMLLKTQGVPVREHAVAIRLLWIRTLLEKLQPVDQRLQYQITKLLQVLDGRRAGDSSAAGEAGKGKDPLALRPGELAAGVEDDDEDGEGTAGPGEANIDTHYKPPKIAQAEFTGGHVSFKEKAERDLERQRDRLEKSEFMRSLREEFTDAPAEIHQEARSARAERAMRKLAEQEAYEEDNMMRIRSSKRQLREQRKLLRERGTNSAGAVSLDDVTVDFKQLRSNLGAEEQQLPGRGKKRGGKRGALEDFNAASERARVSRHVVDSALGGDLEGLGLGKRKGAGQSGAAKRQKRR